MAGKSDKLTKQQEDYVQQLILGKTQRVAYRHAYPKSLKWKDNSVDISASKMFAKPKVKLRFEELRTKVVKSAEEKAICNIDDLLRDLQTIKERCMTAEPVMIRQGNEMVESGEYQFNSAGAIKAIELMGKNLKAWTDKVESTNVNLNHDMTEEEAEKVLKKAGVTI